MPKKNGPKLIKKDKKESEKVGTNLDFILLTSPLFKDLQHALSVSELRIDKNLSIYIFLLQNRFLFKE